MKQSVLLASLTFFFFLNGDAQSVLGKWKTIDDETGEMKSVVELYMKGDKLHGKVIELYRKPNEDPDPVCDDCEDDRKGKKVMGMEIIRDMEKEDEGWEEGTICDPANGKVYDCKLWVDEKDPNKLNVRGYILFLFRTQQWLRHSE